jgi:hypothetical protein
MNTKKIKMLTTVLCTALIVLAMVSSASALIFDAQNYPAPGIGPAYWTGDENGQAAINAIIGPIMGAGYVELYKQNNDGTEVDALASSYSTNRIDGFNWTITYDGGPSIAPPPVYILVKDGNSEPNWYLFKTNWNGTDPLVFENFFDEEGGFVEVGGSISHITLYGTTSTVPEPLTMLLLGLGLVGLAGVGRFRK